MPIIKVTRSEFDVVVACYHDQGLIPIKLVAFGQAVNVTFGLPIIRTSVDHGTAFDIAGKGVADPESMITTVLVAVSLAKGKKDYDKRETIKRREVERETRAAVKSRR